MWILSAGDLFTDRYRILRELGSGGMSYVFAAEDLELNEKVALKIIKPDFVGEEDFVARFKREVRIARQILHPNIIRVHEFGSAVVQGKRLYFLTMELLEGRDLAVWLRERIGSRGIALADLLRIGFQVCDALAEAHRAGVVHRDIKPQNIFIESEGRVKLMDFGISRLQTLPSVTTGGQLVGTPKYMSPEQVHRKTEPDQRSDIYSLGVVLYELATGRAPFDGTSTMEVAFMQVERAPRSPRDLDPAVPERLEAIVLRCLQKDPTDRYPSIEALRADLQSVPASAGAAPEERPTEILSLLPTEKSFGVPRTAVAPPRPETATIPKETIRRRTRPRTWKTLVLASSLLAASLAAILWVRSTPPVEDVPPPVQDVPAPETAPAGPAEPANLPAVATPASRPVELAEPPERPSAPASPPRGASAEPRPERAPPPTIPAHEPPVATPERTEPRSETRTAIVRFTANPETEIYLDGSLLGTIPPIVERELPVGLHTLRYVMPGYAEHEETIEVLAREGQAFSHRFPVPGALRVNAQPYARVLLDGRDLGYTPVRVEKVSEGTHLLVLEREGFRRIEEEIVVKPFEVNLLQYEMVRVP